MMPMYKMLRKKVSLLNQARKKQYQLITGVTSAISTVINIAYMIFNGALGIVCLSLWNGSICVYYFLLGLVRFLVLMGGRKEFSDGAKKKDFYRKVYIRTHLLLLFMDVAMITPIVVMANGGHEFTYGMVPAIALATYTTYRITTAIMHFAKTRKSDNILISELRLINLIDALLALLTLQNALLIATDGFTGEMKTMSMWTSCGSIAVILCLTILSLRKVKTMK